MKDLRGLDRKGQEPHPESQGIPLRVTSALRLLSLAEFCGPRAVVRFCSRMRAPANYVEWVNAHLGFNPRSQANSDALSDFVVSDLRSICPDLRRGLEAGRLVAQKNPNISTKVSERSIDLVIYEKSPTVAVRVSVENKTIMAAHGKARKNRYGDIIAYSNHMHNHNRRCVAGAILVVNVSPLYENPDAFARGLERPKFKMEKVVRDTISIFEKIPLREANEDPNELPEVMAVIVDYDGVNPAKLVTDSRAPKLDAHINYDCFVRRLCDLYTMRFGGS